MSEEVKAEEAKPIKKMYFGLYHLHTGESIASIETDPDIINPERGIIDPHTLTLRSIANGGNYTLQPLPDFIEQTLLRLRRTYNLIVKKPAVSLGNYIGRTDGLIYACADLYGDIEFTVVENKDDLHYLINPKVGHEPKKVKYKVMDELLKRLGIVAADEWATEAESMDSED
jgi:hypothetical protein